MKLKTYQQKAVAILKDYLKELEKVGSKYAFMGVTDKTYNSDFFAETPFVCVKIPTGGGKTLVGCHSIAEIMGTALRNKMEKGIVMWFVPSEAIKSQTLRKFKDRKDIHRRTLDEAFDNNIKIFSNEEALKIRRDDVENNLCIVISSLDAFRKEKTLQSKYKVYQENGSLISHFEVPQNTIELERDEDDSVIHSLANVIRISKPLIVIDEGHKTKTKLSIEFLKDLNPDFIIEYTATPRPESNILVEIHASELKEEEMVKIPIVLESTSQWQNAILRGALQREELEKEALKNKGEYIRPIALLQAQQEKEDDSKITVQKIKDFLIKQRGVKEEEIAIKTSSTNELEGIDLFSKRCKIRYIITVNALAEGWDCSFAYVLISVANLGSKIAVEQIIGRIIRMPNATKKDNENLNRCYIFASAKNFNEAANQIISGLESNGYSKSDLISSTNKSETYELEVERKFKEDLPMPFISFEGERLSFEDLIGEEFELSKQDYKFEFKALYDNDGRALIDIQKGDKWVRGAQQILNLTYRDSNFSREELIRWLDRKMKFTMLDKKDKIIFIQNAIDYQLKKNNLSDLSINRYVLASKLEEIINEILISYAKQRFDEFIKEGKIELASKELFPEKIILNQFSGQKWNKNYYEDVDKLNKEETNFINRLDLDTLPNIKFWARNRERKDFFIQGWRKNKFYPDFIAVTKDNKIIVLEWKGEDRVSNDDTSYKEEIGRVWEKLSKGKNHFFLVHNKNENEVLKEIQKL